MSIIKNSFTIICLCLCLYAQTFAVDISRPEKVVLQLKWQHQFQFAGYYAAKEKGFYAQEGLDVEFRERTLGSAITLPSKASGVDYSIVDSRVIAQYSKGAKIKALAAIFQHNPLVFVSKQSSGIISPYEMINKRIMSASTDGNEAPLYLMLTQEGITPDKYTTLKHSYNKDDLINDKVDVMPIYLTNELFYFKQRDVPLNIINPQSYGIDLYADLLITSDDELVTNPGRADRFRRASIKGWQYALEHSEEIIAVIKNHYNNEKSLQQLRFEAQETYKMIMPDIIPIGQIKANRIRRVADIYTESNLATPLSDKQLQSFIYKSDNKLNFTVQEQSWLNKHPIIRVGIDRDFAPFEWIDDSGRYLGMSADYMRLMEKTLGVKFQIITDKTWQETLDMAKQGELDMLSNAVSTPERLRYLDFTEPYMFSPIVIISDGRYGFIGVLEKLKGKKVAIESGYFMQEIL